MDCLKIKFTNKHKDHLNTILMNEDEDNCKGFSMLFFYNLIILTINIIIAAIGYSISLNINLIDNLSYIDTLNISAIGTVIVIPSLQILFFIIRHIFFENCNGENKIDGNGYVICYNLYISTMYNINFLYFYSFMNIFILCIKFSLLNCVIFIIGALIKEVSINQIVYIAIIGSCVVQAITFLLMFIHNLIINNELYFCLLNFEFYQNPIPEPVPIQIPEPAPIPTAEIIKESVGIV